MLLPALRPDGHLLTEGKADGGEERRLVAAVKAGAGPLLVELGTSFLALPLEPAWAWLRQFAHQFFSRLCQSRDLARLSPLSEAEQSAFLLTSPPFPGGEFLNRDLLGRWWQTMVDEVASRSARHPDGLEGWLAEEAPSWHKVGRVTFHLAENKADPQRPFAFLATFAHRLSAGGQIQHLPLARALQLHTGTQDQAALQMLLEPVRAAASESQLLQDWMQSRRLFQPLALDPPEAYRFLRDSPVYQRSGIVVKLPDWWREGKGRRPLVQVTLDAPEEGAVQAGGMLNFRMETALEGEPLTPQELEKLLSAETGLVSLRGRWVEVHGHRLRQVLDHWQRVQNAVGEGSIGFLEGMRLLAKFVPREQAEAGAAGVEVQEWSEVVAGRRLAQVLEQMRAPGEVEPPPGLRATLRPYQRQGLAWLHFMTRLGLGACLADDMGLGKTLQVIALLLLRKPTADKTSLLIVPASLLGNWQSEIARFAPDLRVLAAHSSTLEKPQLERLIYHPEQALRGQDVMITTYTYLQRTEAWQHHEWGLIILDEAQAIKNPGSGAAQTVKRLQAQGRIALSGTPVENRPGDLWSLFDFLNPGLLGSTSAFLTVVKQCATRPEGYAPLRRLVQPYILRRMKTDRSIIQDLPDKTEVKAWCGLTKRQTVIYAKLADQMARLMRDPVLDPVRRQGLVLGFLIQFKQICNHPSHWNGDGVWNPTDSGKFARLAEICSLIAERRERVLVFTQFQETCDPLARHLSSVFGREGLVLHGGTPVKKRPAIVQAFQEPEGPPFMVISVKAGGTGLTLTAASHVIHFDRWWNPAIENQATDRAFRIGQKKNVLVHKFICQGTIEQRVDALLEKKMALSNALLAPEAGAESMLTELSTEELLRLVSLDVNSALI